MQQMLLMELKCGRKTITENCDWQQRQRSKCVYKKAVGNRIAFLHDFLCQQISYSKKQQTYGYENSPI